MLEIEEVGAALEIEEVEAAQCSRLRRCELRNARD